MDKIRILFFLIIILHAVQADAQEYVPGQIFTRSNDTIPCKILRFKKRSEEYEKSFQAIQVQDDSGKVKVLRPADILGYSKQGKAYKTLTVKAVNQPPLQLFLLQLVRGRGELYQHSGTGLDEVPKYFFRKSFANEFIVLNVPAAPEVKELNDERVDVKAYFPGMMTFQVTQYEDSFRRFFIQYFGDCPAIVNKLKAQIYTTASLEEMFKEYNRQKVQ